MDWPATFTPRDGRAVGGRISRQLPGHEGAFAFKTTAGAIYALPELQRGSLVLKRPEAESTRAMVQELLEGLRTKGVEVAISLH